MVHVNSGRPAAYVVVGQKKEGPLVASGHFSKKGFPGPIDTSGTKNTIKNQEMFEI